MSDTIGEMISAGDFDEYRRLLCALGRNVITQLLDGFQESGEPVSVEISEPDRLIFSIQQEGLAFRIGEGTPVSISLEVARQQAAAC